MKIDFDVFLSILFAMAIVGATVLSAIGLERTSWLLDRETTEEEIYVLCKQRELFAFNQSTLDSIRRDCDMRVNLIK